MARQVDCTTPFHGCGWLIILSLKQSLYGETIMFRTLKFTALTLLAAVSVVVTVQAQQTSLYDNLGGKKAIVAVVDDFVGRVAADNRINAFFAATVDGFAGSLVLLVATAIPAHAERRAVASRIDHFVPEDSRAEKLFKLLTDPFQLSSMGPMSTGSDRSSSS